MNGKLPQSQDFPPKLVDQPVTGVSAPVGGMTFPTPPRPQMTAPPGIVPSHPQPQVLPALPPEIVEWASGIASSLKRIADALESKGT